MARPIKEGLDYFELDCHFGKKLRLIQAEFGWKGLAIVVFLWSEIYGEKGYYMTWDDDASLLFASDYGITGGDKNLIQEVISACIRRDIFSGELFDKYRILTSKEIQKRYLNATSRRERVEMKKEYLLLTVDNNRVNVDRNAVNVDRNAQSREEKIKEENKYSVGNINTVKEEPEETRAQYGVFPQSPIPDLDNAFLQKVMDTWNAIPHTVNLSGIIPMSPRYDHLRMCIGMVGVEGVFAAIQKIANSEYFKQRGSVQFEKYISPGMIQKVMEGTYDKNFQQPSKKETKKTGFNNFHQREYDFDELERKLREKNKL